MSRYDIELPAAITSVYPPNPLPATVRCKIVPVPDFPNSLILGAHVGAANFPTGGKYPREFPTLHYENGTISFITWSKDGASGAMQRVAEALAVANAAIEALAHKSAQQTLLRAEIEHVVNSNAGQAKGS